VAGPDPAERLAALSALRRELDSIETELAAQAVRAGMSWREIGRAIGVSKQAAHRRHSQSIAELEDADRPRPPSPASVGVSMYARRAVRMARFEAARMGENQVGTEHLLLGILQSGDQEAVSVLEEFGVTVARARDAIHPGAEVTLQLEPDAYAAIKRRSVATVVSPLTRRVLERGLTQAAAHGQGPMTTLGLLRAIMAHPDSGAVTTLTRLGVDADDLQAALGGQAPPRRGRTAARSRES